MEYLLLDFFSKVVGHASHKSTLREIGDFRCRDKGVHLRVDGSGRVLPVDGYGLSLLQDFTKPFRQVFSRFSHHLPAENITYRVLDHLRLFVPVITVELREVLKSQADSHFVGTGGGNQVVDAPEINGRQLVYDYGRFELSLFVYQLNDPAVVQSQSRRVDVLTVRVVAHA